LIDQDVSGDPSWLGYRGAFGDETVLLDITHSRRARTITAELWRPGRLTERLRAEATTRVVDERRVWRQGPDANPAWLGRVVAAAVEGWLAVRTGPDGEAG
jgi:hypothetical protein